MKNILYFLLLAISAFFSSCTGEEPILNASVTIPYRDPVITLDKVTLTIPITTINYCMLNAVVEVSTSSQMSKSLEFPIDISYHNNYELKEYQVDLTGLNPGTTYYYRYVITGFTGTDNWTGENSSIKFAKRTFTTPNIDYTIFTDGFVDLGLSVKWHARNLGASFPTEYGLSAGWGDPTGKLTSEIESDYGGQYPPSNISGTELDICFANNPITRLPTYAEMNELLEKCSWIFKEYRGVYGWIVIGTNKKAIFLPGTNEDSKYIPYWTGSFSTSNNKGIILALFNGHSKQPGCYAVQRHFKGYFRPVTTWNFE